MEKRVNYKIQKILKDLKPYNPDKVILFGSYGRGDFDANSDIDLLIIKNNEKKTRVFDRINEVLKFISIRRVDPLVLTEDEIVVRLKENDFFIKDILKEGNVIYEKR